MRENLPKSPVTLDEYAKEPADDSVQSVVDALDQLADVTMTLAILMMEILTPLTTSEGLQVSVLLMLVPAHGAARPAAGRVNAAESIARRTRGFRPTVMSSSLSDW